MIISILFNLKRFLSKLKRSYQSDIKYRRIGLTEIDQHNIRDECYGALWDKETGFQIKNIYQHINTHFSLEDRMKYLDKIHESIKRKWNDQTINPYHHDLYVPLEATYKRDRITFNGVSRIWTKFAGGSALGPTHLAVGAGTSPTTDDMTALENQSAIETLGSDASMSASGSVIRFQGTFDILEPTFTMSEVGVLAGDPGGILVARALFDNPLQHDYGENYPSADYAIYTLTA